MTQGTLLAQALLGYEPIVDRRRNAIAMRLSVDPVAGAAAAGGPNIAALYRELSTHWVGSSGTIALKSSASIDDELLEVEPAKTIWIEVPAAFAETGEGRALLPRLREHGYTMVLGGRTRAPLAPELVPAFGMAIIHVDEDRRLKAQAGVGQAASRPPPVDPRRSIPYVQEGIRTMATMDDCFATGAQAVIGWPMEDAL
ncbi:MAG: hypothetical protein ACLGHY_11725, partial [Gammaproteobacteria bacterium]